MTIIDRYIFKTIFKTTWIVLFVFIALPIDKITLPLFLLLTADILLIWMDPEALFSDEPELKLIFPPV